MLRRRAAAFALCVFILVAGTVRAEARDRYLDKARVLDILFPLDVEPKASLEMMILRFGDSDTQLVVVVYPDKDKYWIRRYDVISYTLRGMKEGQLSEMISKMGAENPSITAEEIAAKIKVDVARSPIDSDLLKRAFDELKGVRISPLLGNRVAVDEYSEYQYWYSGGQESVHYTITGPFKGDPQDKLVQWMIKFRANLPNLLKASSTTKP